MITDPVARRHKVAESLKLFDSSAEMTRQYGRTLLQLATHPDTNPQDLAECAGVYRATVQNVLQVKEKLLEIAHKERMPLLTIDRLKKTKVLP